MGGSASAPVWCFRKDEAPYKTLDSETKTFSIITKERWMETLHQNPIPHGLKNERNDSRNSLRNRSVNTRINKNCRYSTFGIRTRKEKGRPMLTSLVVPNQGPCLLYPHRHPPPIFQDGEVFTSPQNKNESHLKILFPVASTMPKRSEEKC
jgi:hypothetical protein